MATLAMMAGGALINALAFSGTNAAFSLLGDHGGTERKRHDIAIEQLNKAREDWSRDRQQRLDLINKTLSDQRHAKQTFSDLGIAMQEYQRGDRQNQSLMTFFHRKDSERSNQSLMTFKGERCNLNVSRERKDAEIALVVGGMTFCQHVDRDHTIASTSICKLWVNK